MLEDDDILEMVNAGLMPITVVDDYLAQFWQQVFTDITVHAASRRSDGRHTGHRLPQGESEAACRGGRVGRSSTVVATRCVRCSSSAT